MPTDAVSRQSLHVDVKNRILRQIDSGTLKEGDKLRSERELSIDYGVSRWTVMEALHLLEAEGVVRKVPCKGVFVADQLDRTSKQVEIYLVLPSERIDEASLGFAGWQRYLEIGAGLLEGAKASGLRLRMVPQSGVCAALESAQNVAAAVFYTPVFDAVAELVVRRKIHGIVTGPNAPAPGFSSVLYDRDAAIAQLVAKIAATACTTVGMLIPPLAQASRAAQIRLGLEMEGVLVDPDWMIVLDPDNIDGMCEALDKRLPHRPSDLPELLYCDRMTFPMALLRVMAKRRWRMGDEVRAVAFTCRSAVQSMSPEIGYMRIPYFEMGLEACALAARRLAATGTGAGRPEHIRLPAEWIPGRVERLTAQDVKETRERRAREQAQADAQLPARPRRRTREDGR